MQTREYMMIRFRNLILPVIIAFYPVIFLYSYNGKILQPGSLVFPLLLMLLITAGVFGLFFAFQRNAAQASLSTVLFLVLFYLYSPAYQLLLKVNLIPIEHFTLIPVFLILAGYAGYFARFIKPKAMVSIQNIFLIVGVVLVCFNILRAVPVEIRKAQMQQQPKTVIQAAAEPAGKKAPDIYYLLFDEYAGFNAIREYWQDNDINEFETFLKQKHFFVANNSRSPTTDTVHEMASRLNMTRYTDPTMDPQVLFQAIADNKVMRMMKSYGYTTVIFNGINLAYPSFNKVNADVDIEYDAKSIGQTGGPVIDDFGQMFLDRTMLVTFANLYKYRDPDVAKYRDMFFYTLDHAGSLTGVKSPKFVYVHLLFPHDPFIFDENGGEISLTNEYNWNYYLGQHKYATKAAEKLISQIFAGADPNNPPVVVVQSDHGARNHAGATSESVLLKDYPEKYQHDILNAQFLPGFDYSSLSDDMDPTATFAVILNHYFNAGVTVSEPAAGK